MNTLDSGGEAMDPVPYVVHGSFRKNLGAIQSAISTLDGSGCAYAIAPHDCTAADEKEGFVLLSGEQGKDPRQIEAEYLQKVLSLRMLGGFSLWVAPDGYVGKSGAYEYGVAQACGVPAFFTETPDDVPFYVSPDSIKTAEQLASQLRRDRRIIAPPTPEHDAVGRMWEQLSLPTALVAVGGIISHRNHLLLVEDGRWPDNQLTVPGTTVRAHETREVALRRALTGKFGLDATGVAPLITSFMLDGSGYAKPVETLVFDDRIVSVSSKRTELPDGLVAHWVSPAEAQELAEAGQVEPNAALLVNEYLARAV